MRVMALDWGTRRIGVAVSDGLGLAAHGLPTLVRRNIRSDLDALAALIRERSIETVVIGHPLHLDGRESPASRRTAKFARRLARHAHVETRLWDERLTSWAAEELLGSRPRNRGATDQMAAILLLESYLAAPRT